ncbi:MAG: class I SAM-dependent methyltransferase [Deltaproteobacteria bacterium]|nr:class I SAM-dependent methyltransferase [Deltaproteobacteria bacterium]
MERQEKVITSYARMASVYDRRFRGYIARTISTALEMLQLTGTERILDVACGTGELERRILEVHPQQPIWGIDLTEEMLVAAREKLGEVPNIQWERADSRYLPFPDAHFDIVVTLSAFHYMREPQRVVNEFARVVRPGGRVVVLDWCRDFLFAQLYHLMRKVFFPQHYRVYHLAEMQQLMRDAGLTPADYRQFTVLGMWKMMCVEGKKAAGC